MLTLRSGSQGRLCDGVSRRDFLRIGALGVGGLSLPQLLRAEAEANVEGSNKAVIMILLAGGPSHQDMFDLKMDAPSEIRGEFRPIPTNVPGIEICEHLPRMAKIMDKLVPIRSIVGCQNKHALTQCLTGREKNEYWPSIGSVLSELRGPTSLGVPPSVGMGIKTTFPGWREVGLPGFLGAAHSVFRPQGDERADMTLNVPLERLRDRRRLVESLDGFRRQVDTDPTIHALDSFQRQAFDVLTSNKLVEALDIEREDPRVRERYGRGSLEPMLDGPALYNEYLLMARRLVEAGVRCVTLTFGRWDTHGGPMDTGQSNFEIMRQKLLPAFDQAVTALVEDLHERGMQNDVSVVAWGEFGRTPRINKQGGRDHWPRVSTALLAGGGMRTGQVIGATDRLGGEATERPVHPQEVLATLYHNLGIDVEQTHLKDQAGRPQFLVDEGRRPIAEVL